MALSYDLLKEEDYEQLNEQKLRGQDAIGVLKWAYETFQDDIVYSCSFGAEGVVLIDLISKVKPDARIVFLDTELHFQETYDLIEKVKAKYPSLNIKMLKSEVTLEQQKALYGDKLWETNPDLCCEIRKLKPLAKELANYKAWISGLRREQSPTRRHVQFVNRDDRFKSIKICPLIHWTWEEVWNYIKLFDLPYNVLHDQNYPSIGCEKCTQPVKEGQDLRSGRWANFAKTECGLHLNTK